MNKFTTAQLQAAMINLHKRNDQQAREAYAMTFGEVHARMGDEAFDAWLDANGL